MNNNKPLYYCWLVFLGVVIILGVFAAFKIFAEGHWLFNSNDVIIWSLPLGVYIYLALTSSGLALLASLPLVFNFKKYDPLAKRLVFLSLATLIGAFVSIGLELGSMSHMIYLLLSPNISSPIWWMGAIYSIELVLLIIKFRNMHTGNSTGQFDRFLGIGSFLCAMTAPLMIGAVFGITESRVTYFGPLMSIYCLLMALLSGSALFVFYNLVLDRVCQNNMSQGWKSLSDDFVKIFSWMLGIVVVFTLAKIAIESSTTIPDFLNYRKFEHAFGAIGVFHIEVIAGLFIPFILMMIPQGRDSGSGRIWASGLVLAGTLAMHMEILLAGQSHPIGPKAEQFPVMMSYFPSSWEWLVALFAVGVMMGGYTLGEKYLNLEPE